MSRAGFGLSRMFAKEQAHPVVQGGDIGNADNKMSADLKYSRHFMNDPEQFFHMLEQLIGNNYVKAFRSKRQFACFKIALPGLYAEPFQRSSIFRSAFNGICCNIRIKQPGGLKISPRTSANIKNCFRHGALMKKTFHHSRGGRLLTQAPVRFQSKIALTSSSSLMPIQ